MKTDTQPNRTLSEARQRIAEQEVKGLQPIEESNYYNNISNRELQIFTKRRRSKNFKFILPSKEVQELLDERVTDLQTKVRLYNEAIEINSSYKLTAEDIIIAYRCNLIVFQYGDVFISGIDRDSIIEFKMDFVKRIRKQNIAEAEKKQNK